MPTAIPKNRAETSAAEAARVARGVVLHDDHRVARGIVSDTRAIEGGEAFVALRGEHHDAHDFLDEAARRGAALVVVDRDVKLRGGPSAVRVDDTLVAWGDLARAHVRSWRAARTDARVIAITGSAGKTTTKQLCAALLGESTWASPGNLNNLIGVPAVAFALEASHRFAVIECGMSVRGEIARLASIVDADVAVITNVSIAHAEGVGGAREDVGREKGALFDALGEDGACVFDADDDLSAALAARSKARRKIGFGRTERAHYRLIDRVARGSAGSRVTIERTSESHAKDLVEAELPFVGEAAAIDLCAALAAADATREPIVQRELDEAMTRAKNIEGRAAIVDLGEILVIDDTYNANPASMRAALSILADVAGADRRRVAILGEMKELGPAAKSEHVALGDALANARVALAIGCGGLASETMARASALHVDAIAEGDVVAATRSALERVRPGDVVLVKGSRSVGAERVVAALREKFGERS
jgi:UDP-N-acetylmuramoyl-tripeptide--D-alanyl-D-alanine ligase